MLIELLQLAVVQLLVVVVVVVMMIQVAEIHVMIEMICWRACDHVWSLVALHVRCQGGRCIITSITYSTLEGLSVVVCFKVDF